MENETIILKPIEPPKVDLADKQQLYLQFNYATWRIHLWGKNYGSYQQIERKVSKGKLMPLVCPDAECDCTYEKEIKISTTVSANKA